MTNFKFQKSAKLLLLLAVFVLVAAGCNKVQTEQQQDQPAQNQAKPGQQATTSNGQTPISKNPGGVTKAQTITVTQTVEGSNFNKPNNVVPSGESAIDLLKRDHQVEVKEYSGAGEFVVSIDGVKPDSKRFWAFYVNGKSSNVGAGSYKPNDGDKIEWKLETIK